MTFVLTNVIYIVYDRKNENHWHYLLLITRYSLLGIQTPHKGYSTNSTVNTLNTEHFYYKQDLLAIGD